MVVAPPAAETIFEKFEIEFDAGPEPVFHGGELVTGSLKIQLKNEITINAIRVQFRGRAVFLGPGGNKKATEGQKEKIYFDKDFVLLERPPGHPEPGHFPWNANFLYSLPFECPLPRGCETSFEGPHGFIRYYARAILETDQPSKAHYLVKKAFSIVSPPELHQLIPPQSEPISEKKTVRFGGCCCRGKMSAEIHLPKSAYAPGENIVGEFTMDARTAKNAIEHIEVRLVDKLQRILEKEGEEEVQPETSPLNNNKNGEEGKKAEEANQNEKKTKEKPQKKKKKVAASKEEAPAQRVVLGRKLVKEDFMAQLEKGAQTVTQTNVLFIRVPAITPSTQIEKQPKSLQQSMLFDELLDGEDAENGAATQFHRLLESPSTATLRARKEPFLRVDYALQISIGTQVLLELPIQVHPIPIYAKGIQFRPFAAGAQPIGESDESSLIPFNGPFTFTPQYPIYLESPKPVASDNEDVQVVAAETEQAISISRAEKVPNGVHDGQPMHVTSTTVSTVTSEKLLPDGTKVERREEIIVENQRGSAADGPSAGMEEVRHNDAIVEEQELAKSRNELGQQTIVAPNNEGENDIPPGQENGPSSVAAAAPVEHKHFEQEEQLANGHSLHKVVDEWTENGGDGEIRRVVEEEQYEVQNEDGSKVTIQKTTEKISSVETRVVEGMANGGGGDQSKKREGSEQKNEEGQENNNNNNNDGGGGGEHNNQQMDISMSG